MLENIKSLIEKTQATNSKLEKINIIKNHDPKYLHYIFDYDITYGVTSKNILQQKSTLTPLFPVSMESLLDSLSNREFTGKMALAYVLGFIEQNKEYEDVILKIIDKDLKCGFGVSTINKAHPNLIKEFKVALANSYEPRLIKGGGWLISEKKDGVRCICIIKNHIPTFYSRQGKIFTTLDKIGEELKHLDDCILDGEVIIDNDFTKTMNEIKKKDHTISNATYFLFDRLESFEDTRGFLTRIDSLEETPSVKILPQYLFSALEKLKARSIEEGWEGLMLRANTPWKGKRSNDLLKYKLFADKEFIVKDIEISDNGKNKGLIKSLIIDNKGVLVNVGSGLSEEQRKLPGEYWIDREITVQYFEETNDGSLRFPTLKAVYESKRDI